MAVIEGGVSGTLMGVGAQASAPGHVTQMPNDYGAGGHFRVGAVTGTLPVSLAAASELFQFRYVTSASRLAVIYRVGISAGANAAATAAALIALRMTVARAWTVDGTGGTALTLTGDNAQMRTPMAASEVVSARIATTVALGLGTKTLDATDISAIATGIGTGAITAALDFKIFSLSFIFDPGGDGSHPLVLSNQEGFVLRTGAVVFPAGMTWHLSVNVLWGEVPAY